MLIVIVALALSTTVAIAAWQKTKTVQTMSFVIESGPAADTFRIVGADCGAAMVGDTEWCYLWVENLSATTMTMDAVVVTANRSDVTVSQPSGLPETVDPNDVGGVSFTWEPHANASPGPVTFTIEVTCSGG